jgi:hypothetical protein
MGAENTTGRNMHGKRSFRRKPVQPGAESLASGQAKVHNHLGLHGHWLAVEQVWLRTPLFHGFDRRGSERSFS